MEDESLHGKFDLVFGDPPFNIGHGYADFDDSFTPEEYADFTNKWLYSGWEMVAPGGVLAIHGSVPLLPIYWDAVLVCPNLTQCFENHIVWHYRFGQNQPNNWIDNHCNCLIFRKPGERKFFPDQVQVVSDRVAYGDKRVNKESKEAAEKAGRTVGTRVAGTVWGTPSDGTYWSRVVGQNKEKVQDAPNQLPTRYMQRLVFGYTEEGGSVADLFAGTGTLGLVCKHESRNYQGYDVSAVHAAVARNRINNGFYRRADNV